MTNPVRVGPFTEPPEAARAAALRHVADDRPGITRRRAGKGFSYRDAEGRLVRDRGTLGRIRSLAIPPAWTDVWICPLEHGHVQATGRDAKGRKQYRYHPRWRAVRDETKYGRLLHFGEALPRIRRGVSRDLDARGLPRERVLATILRLLETTFIRVGNEEYAKANGSFGLTTMLDRHVEVVGPEIRFRFKGKSGKAHEIRMSNPRLAKIVRKCRDLPGQDLFQFIDDAGEPQPVSSGDVNDYLRTLSGEDFTAKDFRTWAGTLLAARMLTSALDDDATTPRKLMLRAVESVAEQLGNTPAVCRKSYIHPAILEAFEDESMRKRWCAAGDDPSAAPGLRAEERKLLHFLAGPAAEVRAIPIRTRAPRGALPPTIASRSPRVRRYSALR